MEDKNKFREHNCKINNFCLHCCNDEDNSDLMIHRHNTEKCEFYKNQSIQFFQDLTRCSYGQTS